MSNNSTTFTSRKILESLVLLLLGATIPIIVSNIFRDDFYPALIITVIVLVVLFLALGSSTGVKVIASVFSVAVAIILVIIYRNSNSPNFEINFIGLPFEGDDSYYVTDALIRSDGDLSVYDDFVLSPISVEVIPRYSGDEKFGNVALRISGIASTKDFPLWTDFDKSAQTQTIKLDLADLLGISGIRRIREDIVSSLMLGDKPYQEAVLKFEVIRPSEPRKPFNATKELPVKNVPWKQEIAVTYRNGLVLDYALTNFGAEAKFGCNITIAKTLSDVTEDSHFFWSGTEVFSYGPDCETFALKTGETYKTTIPLNKDTLGRDFPHGRYLIQVFSFAERKDVVFNTVYSFENSNDRWVFGDDGDVVTFVICNDPGTSCAETDTLPIEEETIRAYPWNDDRDNGFTYFLIRTYFIDNRSTNEYILDYWLDPQRDGWVGFGIWFENLVDVSAYNSIRFKLILDKSLHPIWLDMECKTGASFEQSRLLIGDGTYGNPTPDIQTVVVPFSAFKWGDCAIIDTIDFAIDHYMVPDTEKHTIRVSEIEFIR